MKANIHPSYGLVIFTDAATGVKYPIPSTLGSEDAVRHISVDVSASSHSFWTPGRTERRSSAVEKFNRRFACPTSPRR